MICKTQMKTRMIRKYRHEALSFAAATMSFLAVAAVAAEPKGEIDTDLDAKAAVSASELGSGEFVISAGEGWIPFEYRKAVEPGSALDFSKLSHRHAPAGKFGRVVAKGGHFEFERLPVFIALDGAKKCRVHALDVSGRRVGEVPCAFDKGFLSFTADTKGPDGKGVLAWEIVR